MAEELKPGSSNTSIKKESDFKSSVEGSKVRSLDEIRSAAKGTSTRKVKEKKKESVWKSLLIAALVAIGIRAFFVEAFRIPTGSMKNTLLIGDYLFVNKTAYAFSSPKYLPFTSIPIPYFSIGTGTVKSGDILVFEYPGDRDLTVPRERNINYIKRCIGTPGDVVEVRNQAVYVNGKEFQNPPGVRVNEPAAQQGQYDSRLFPRNAQWNIDWYGPIRVPKKGDVLKLDRDNIEQWEVFIAREGHQVQLGSNAQIEIDGKPTDSYTVERDYLFMMGDNRHNSEDSRVWGFCPLDNVVGEAMFIYWSWYRPGGTFQDGYDEEEVQETQIRWNRIGKIVR